MGECMSTIKFYPFSELSLTFAPQPIAAASMIPDWYKRQSSSGNNEETIGLGFTSSTIKRCMPIFDLMSSGYFLLAPCDIYIDSSKPDKLEYSIPDAIKEVTENFFSSHNKAQYEELPYDRKYYHKDLLRINPLWSLSTPPGYSTILINPPFKDSLPIEAVSALIDTDKYISEGHLSFFVKSGFTGIVKQGTPLIQVIPFKRESWSSELVDTKTATEKLNKQFFNIRSTFINGYKNKMRTKKEYK